MAKKIVLVIVIVLIGFLGFVSTKESKFNYEKSGLINAPAEKIFPYLSDFTKGKEWSPYEMTDPNMKRTYNGPPNQVDSEMLWEGNSEAGAGSLKFMKIVPNQEVVIKLTMVKPIRGENIVIYRLTPEGTGTKFTWSMSGDGGFLTKLISTFIDCEKMVTGQWQTGIDNLKKLTEAPTANSTN